MATFDLENAIRKGVEKALNSKIDGKSITQWAAIGMKAPRWVSVEDRLPEKEGQYLCWFGKNILAKGAAIATYLERWKEFGSLEWHEIYPNVTHWMSLPEPPEVDE